MPPTPLPLRTNSRNAARRSSVVFFDAARASGVSASGAISKKQPVVLDRKMASYCFRFAALMTAGSQETSVVHAPVFLPSSSIAFTASGIDECWNPADGMRDQASTLWAFSGLAGAVAGSAAIIAAMCSAQASVGFWLRPPHGSLRPGVVAPATNGPGAPRPPPPGDPGPPAPPGRPPAPGATGAPPAGGAAAGNSALIAVVSCACVTEPLFDASAAVYHASNAARTSAPVTKLSFGWVSKAAHSTAAGVAGAGACCALSPA